MDDGYIKYYRKQKYNIFLMNDNNAFMVFSKLLLFVNRNGEIAAGRRQLGELLNVKDRTLYDILVRLEKQGMIAITSQHKYSIIKIKNWSKYQLAANRGEINKTTASPTAQQQIGITESQPPIRPQPNHNPTTTQHSNKNKNKKVIQGSTELEPELNDYLEMRKTMKKTATPKAVELVIKKLEQMYPGDVPAQKASLEQSTMNNWAGVFELKEPVGTINHNDRIRKLKERDEAFRRTAG